MITRRHAVGIAAAAAALGGLAGPARAFRIQEATEEVKEARFATCGGKEAAEHDKIRAEIARLLGEPALPQDERARLARGLACPLCGNLIGAGC